MQIKFLFFIHNMMQTKVKTQTVTNTQLATAVVAAFLAGGLAFAAAPAANQAAPVPGACVLSVATMVYTHAINRTRNLCPNNGYWGARFTCTDRRNDTVNVGVGNPCVTQEQIFAMAQAKCADQTHACVPRNAIAAPPAVIAGTLLMQIDNNYPALSNDRYALAGTQKFLAGRIKLEAANENINLRSLAVLFSPNSVNTNLDNLRNSIDSIMLYSDPSMADAQLLSRADFVSPTTTFENVTYTVTKDTPSYLYIALKLNSVGTAFDGTAVPNSSFKIAVAGSGHNVTGVNSAAAISPATSDTKTNDITIVPIKIADVSSFFEGGTLVGGNQTIFSFRVTADAAFGVVADVDRNTDEFGNMLSVHLLQLGLQLSTDVGTAIASNTSALQLCRVGSGQCIDLGTSGGSILSATNTTVTLVNAGTGTSTINMSAFAQDHDEYVQSRETVEYIVKGTFSNTTDHFVQVRLINLNNKGLSYGVDTSGDGQDDYFFYDIRRNAPRGNDYPNITGRSLN